MTSKIIIEPVTRVEGHAKVTIHLDDNGNVEKAKMHVTQVRGFEKFCEGRLFWEMPSITARICGICPVSHQLASAKAGDEILGIKLTPTAGALRRLLHMAQLLQSHALHFFYLASPDLLLGMESDPLKRNLVGLLETSPDLVKKGVALRSFGQRIIEILGDKKIHPTAAIPGGMTKALSQQDRAAIMMGIDSVISNSLLAVDIVKDYIARSETEVASFANFPSSYMGLVDADGNVEYYDGFIRFRDSNGNTLDDKLDPHDYLSYIQEKVEDWSYLKFPFIKKFGYPEGMYRVGPLGRYNVSDGYDTPLANKSFQELRSKPIPENKVLQGSLYYHLTRMIEMLNTAEKIKALVEKDVICGTDIWQTTGPVNEEGIGVIEAPRGTLIHHYWADKSGAIRKVNLIVATGHNNLAMNLAVSDVARQNIKNGYVTEGILNKVEVAIRCYDPCFSCSTHALGHMPLEIVIQEADGRTRQVIRN
ncbi:MAG: Ni/Fe hydrogenase subunit alpha [Dehalococcoidales bacterium]|nr:Ni/Fe hydrogenase subunit alpha [Dehalococcoidales bacterium]